MTRILFFILVCALAPGARSQMYKCVDERGVTHYTDGPRPGCKGGPVNIQSSPPISGALAPGRGADLSQQDADFKRRQLEREQAESKDKQALAARCARLRREHAVLTAGTRVYRYNEKNERVYVEDGTRDARLARLQDELRTCP